jgi:nickel superoxide dismutase
MGKVKRYWFGGAVVFLVSLFPLGSIVLSHCEIPCGIYDDPMRIEMISEHIDTIEKSIKEVHRLRSADKKNYNQLTRWVMNKENHADMLSEIVTQYFLTQRISPADTGNEETQEYYIKELKLSHKMMVYSMKCKQTTDLDYIKKLRETLKEFARVYSEHYPERMKVKAGWKAEVDMKDGNKGNIMDKANTEIHKHNDAENGHGHSHEDGHRHHY